MSASSVLSRSSWHNLATGGDDTIPSSTGHGWRKGPGNSPTVFNAVVKVAQFRDGRADNLKAKAKGPVQAGVEMANTPDKLIMTTTRLA